MTVKFYRSEHAVINAVLRALSSVPHRGIGCIPDCDKVLNRPATHMVIIHRQAPGSASRVAAVGLVMEQVRALPGDAFGEYLAELLVRTEASLKGDGRYEEAEIIVESAESE